MLNSNSELPPSLPKLPNGWEWYPLAELLEDDRGISYGIVQPGSHNPEGIPIIRVNNLQDGRIVIDDVKRVTPEIEDSYTRTRLQGGEVLLSLVGSLGATAVVPEELTGWNIARAVALIPVHSDIGAHWVDYCLRTSLLQHYIHVWASTTVQATLNLRDVKNLPIPIPPDAERVEIAHILGTLDDKIELNRRMNATLEAMARAIFKSWFVDFDPVHAKARGEQPSGMDAATAALFPDSFEESELGLIPEGWEIVTIKDIANVVDYVANGSFATLKSNVTLYDEPNYAIYVRTTDFKKGFAGKLKYTDKHSYDFLRKSFLDGAEVIISNVGDTGTVFRPPVWLGKPLTLGSNAIALKADNFNEFLYHYFLSHLGQWSIESIVSGSAQPKFNKTDFRSLLGLIPEYAHFFTLLSM